MKDSSIKQEADMKNYIVSTIQYNSVVNKNLFTNMITFAKKHRVGKIYLFVMAGKTKDEDIIPTSLLENEMIEFVTLNKSGIKMNSNLKLFDTGILASQINPLTGFAKKLNRDTSFILPSPKIRYLSIPNTSTKPRFLATTGALTHGNYKMHIAQGRKADLEHEYGFSFVEIKNNRLFNFHPVMALKNGNFNYNREFYRNGKLEDQQPEALVLGDWHTGDTCPKVRKETVKMIKELSPKRVVFHDFFNGHSINHHEQNNCLSKAQLWAKNKHVLKEEITISLKELDFFSNKFPEVEFLVVESNHDAFLSLYLGNGDFPHDAENSIFASELFARVGKERSAGLYNPVMKTAMELIGNIPENVRFLKEDEEYRVKGVALDYHGHRGINGARGTSASFDRNNLCMITGHEHTPKIFANGMVVGTSTTLKLGYTHGAGSWLNAHGLLYPSGKYTLLTIIF